MVHLLNPSVTKVVFTASLHLYTYGVSGCVPWCIIASPMQHQPLCYKEAVWGVLHRNKPMQLCCNLLASLMHMRRCTTSNCAVFVTSGLILHRRIQPLHVHLWCKGCASKMHEMHHVTQKQGEWDAPALHLLSPSLGAKSGVVHRRGPPHHFIPKGTAVCASNQPRGMGCKGMKWCGAHDG